jgi:hypothetical protein
MPRAGSNRREPPRARGAPGASAGSLCGDATERARRSVQGGRSTQSRETANPTWGGTGQREKVDSSRVSAPRPPRMASPAPTPKSVPTASVPTTEATTRTATAGRTSGPERGSRSPHPAREGQGPNRGAPGAGPPGRHAGTGPGRTGRGGRRCRGDGDASAPRRERAAKSVAPRLAGTGTCSSASVGTRSRRYGTSTWVTSGSAN